MPRFFFHLHDGTDHPDREGSFLPSLEAARGHAAAYLGKLLRDGGNEIWNGEDWRLNVADETGLVLLTIYIFAIESAAGSQLARSSLCLENGGPTTGPDEIQVMSDQSA